MSQTKTKMSVADKLNKEIDKKIKALENAKKEIAKSISLAENAIQELEGLGSADKIAEKLKQSKIKGVRHDTDTCPVAIYLQKKLKYTTVSVNDEITIPINMGDEAEFMLEDIDVNGYSYDGTITVKTPKNINKFIANFDDNKYSELDEEYNKDEERVNEKE